MDVIPRISGYQPANWDSYRQFAAKAFGPGAYQASVHYRRWLYDENPCGAIRERDFLVGLTPQNEVVACVHKMRMPWRIAGEIVDVPAVHNLMVLPEYREGVGIVLVLKSFRSERFAFIAGVEDPLASAYSKLRCQAIVAGWYRCILSPCRGLLRLGMKRLVSSSGNSRYCYATRSSRDNYTLDTSPDFREIERLSKELNNQNEALDTVAWTPELVKWRFFHPLGPRHLLLRDTSQESTFAILSLGPRKGLNVARVIQCCGENDRLLHRLLEVSAVVMRGFGAHLLLVYAAGGMKAPISKLWKSTGSALSSFLYQEKPTNPMLDISVMGSAGDYGFEALHRC